jgi:hypothetical protein
MNMKQVILTVALVWVVVCLVGFAVYVTMVNNIFAVMF